MRRVGHPQLAITNHLELDEPTLVARIQAGDEQAFEVLFRATYDDLCTFADRYIAAPDISEELVEDVFFRLWERRETWTLPRGGIRPYLFAAVRNRALNITRHTRVETHRHAELAQDVDAMDRPDAHETLEHTDQLTALRNAVATLAPARQRVLALRWHEGKSYAEIAKEVGSTVRAVEIQLARALKALRRVLGN